MCLKCSKSDNPESGVVKIGIHQSMSNLRAHKRYNHPKEFEDLNNSGNLKTPTTSIKNMAGFTVKLSAKCTKLVYRTAAATLAIEEGIP